MKLNVSLGAKNIELEVDKLAEQASGSVTARCGDTLVLTTCTMGQEKPDLGFFPLTVEYQERYYAAGKIKGKADEASKWLMPICAGMPIRRARCHGTISSTP